MKNGLQLTTAESWWDLERTTQLIYKAVPLLKYVHFQLRQVTTEQVIGILPLCTESTNHNGSHFGMAIGMAADAVGALLMAVAAGPVRMIGVHPQHDDNGAAVWLVRAHMDYLRPSVEDLVVSASISTEASERIARRYAAQKRSIEEVTLACESRGEIVARGTFTYVVQPARTLKPRTPTTRNSLLYQHKITASARLVAAVARHGSLAAFATVCRSMGRYRRRSAWPLSGRTHDAYPACSSCYDRVQDSLSRRCRRASRRGGHHAGADPWRRI